MTRLQKLGVALTCGLLFLGATPVLVADQPFRGIADLTITDEQQVKEGLFDTFTIAGFGDPLRDFTGDGTFFLGIPGGQILNGQLGLVDDNGNGVVLEFDGQVLDDSSILGEFRITGGSGLFQFAQGSGHFIGTVDDIITIAFDGRIRLP